MIAFLIGLGAVALIGVIAWFIAPWLDCERGSRGGMP